MNTDIGPGLNFSRVTIFPYTPPNGNHIRKIFVPSGGVVVVKGATSISIVEAEIAAINNQPVYLTSITSATNNVVYVTE